jgi:hypothetical protein
MRTCAVAFVGLALAGAAARAETPTEQTHEPADGPYTGSMAIADAASLALVGGGYVWLRSTADCNCEDVGGGYVMLLGVAGYVSWPALLHHDHGSDGRAATSVIARVALPIAAGLVASHFTDRDLVIAGAIGGGATTAIALDWLVLARPPARARNGAATVMFGAPVRGGAIAGFSGAW